MPNPGSLSQVSTNDCQSDKLLPELKWFVDIGKGGRSANRAVDQLYRAYARRFLTYLCSRGLQITEAEDVVSQFFERLLKQRARLQEVTHPRGYIWRMLSNCLMDHYKSMNREPAFMGDDVLLDRVDCSIDVDLQDYLDCVARAMLQFRARSEGKANAIELVAFSGLSGKELALALDKSYGATREYLSQARKEFSSLSEQMCGESPRNMIEEVRDHG